MNSKLENKANRKLLNESNKLQEVDYINDAKFDQGSDTVKEIRNRLIAKHGKENVERGMAAIEQQRTITDLLASRRKKLKINQNDIAQAIDVSRNQVIRYENHKQEPTLTKFLNLLDNLGLEISIKERDSNKELYHT